MRLGVDHLSLPREGEQVSGDAIVTRSEGGRELVAVLDALGHGAHACAVVERAAAALAEAPLDGGLAPIVERVHVALHGTRGAAAMVCLVDGDGRLQGCGVGNVELRSLGANLPVVLSPGILGVKPCRYRVFEGKISAGARLVLFSDGVSPKFSLADLRHLGRPEACRALMAAGRRAHDDATVMIADVLADVFEGAA